MRLPFIPFILPYSASLAAGVAFYVAGRVAVALPPDARLAAIEGAFAAGILATFVLASVAASLRAPLRRALRLALTPTLLFATGYAMFLIVERDATRILIAAAVIGLIGAFLLTVEGSADPSPRYGPQDLAHLAFALHALACFFGLAFLFELASFSGINPAFATAGAGVLIGAIAFETFWYEGFTARAGLPLAFMFAILGAEFHAALSFLPVLTIVDAALAITLFVPALSATVLVLKGAKPSRGTFILSAILAIVVLVTARWN